MAAARAPTSRASMPAALALPAPCSSATAPALSASRSSSAIRLTSSDPARSCTIAGAIVPAAPSTATLICASAMVVHRSGGLFGRSVQRSDTLWSNRGLPALHRFRIALESTTVRQATEPGLDPTAPGAKGLKTDAIGYISNLVIAVASTAPAYSLAATLGFIVAVQGVGTHAPAVLIVSFIPILLVSVGYRFLNLADPDAGTTFAWTTRAFGPQIGWVNGWAIFLADIIVMASLAEIASNYTFLLVGWHSAANSNLALIIGAVIWIAVMTGICYRGIELSARVQTFLLSLEVVTLALFVIVALVTVYANHPAHSLHVSASWFITFDLSWS